MSKEAGKSPQDRITTSKTLCQSKYEDTQTGSSFNRSNYSNYKNETNDIHFKRVYSGRKSYKDCNEKSWSPSQNPVSPKSRTLSTSRSSSRQLSFSSGGEESEAISQNQSMHRKSISKSVLIERSSNSMQRSQSSYEEVNGSKQGCLGKARSFNSHEDHSLQAGTVSYSVREENTNNLQKSVYQPDDICSNNPKIDIMKEMECLKKLGEFLKEKEKTKISDINVEKNRNKERIETSFETAVVETIDVDSEPEVIKIEQSDEDDEIVEISEQVTANRLPTSIPTYTPIGQSNFIRDIVTLTKDLENGIGFCYWGAELIAWKGQQSTDASPWENQALFDFNNKALPVLNEFNR